MRKAAYLQVTRKCNNLCRFCSNPQFEQEPTRDLLFQQIDGFKKEGFDEIILTGGEPTISHYILDVVRAVADAGMSPRIISNGVELGAGLAKSLKSAGLEGINISIHHHHHHEADLLSQRRGHFRKSLEGVANAIAANINVTINSTINSSNAGSLSRLVMFIFDRFPEVGHFVFNNLDPGNADGVIRSRVSENPDVVARLVDFELELAKTAHILVQAGKTFRIERVPLCYMRGFEEMSTETRKIVKDERYTCAFLRADKTYDIRTVPSSVRRVKGGVCRSCRLNEICAGVQKEYAIMHGIGEVSPSFSDPEAIRERIRDM